MSCWRAIRAQKLFAESARNESLADILPADRQVFGKSDVGVQRHQWRIVPALRARMSTVKPMRPTAYEDNLIQPGLKCLHKRAKLNPVRIRGHRHLSPGAATQVRASESPPLELALAQGEWRRPAKFAEHLILARHLL